VTAYSEYAINAFELSALDYILKPIRIEAIERAIHKIKPKVMEHLDVLQDNLEHHLAKKIALQTGDGITIIPLKDVLYLKADGSYTHFFTTDKKKITVSKKIAEYERLEQIGDFIRIHRSHIVNVDKVVKILKQDGGTVMMENGDLLSISNEKKQELIKMFEHKM
jgi:two-component system LytT family response regulator